MEPIEPPPPVRHWPWFAAGLAAGILLAVAVAALDRDGRLLPPVPPSEPKLDDFVLWQRPVAPPDQAMTEDVTLPLPDKSALVLHRDGQTITSRSPDGAERWTKNLVQGNNLDRVPGGHIVTAYVSKILSPVQVAKLHVTKELDSYDDTDYYRVFLTNNKYGLLNYKTGRYYYLGSD